MKKKIKAIVAAFLAICACMAISGCGSEGDDLEGRLEALDEMDPGEAEDYIEDGLERLE